MDAASRARRPDGDLLAGRGGGRPRPAGAVVASTLASERSRAARAGCARSPRGGADRSSSATAARSPSSRRRCVREASSSSGEAGARSPRRRARADLGARLLRPKTACARSPEEPQPKPRASGDAEASSRCVGCSRSCSFVGGLAALLLAPPRRAPRTRAPLLRRRLDGDARARRSRGRAAARARPQRALTTDDARRARRSSASTRCSRATSSSARAAARPTTWTSTASRRCPSCSGRSGSGSPQRRASTSRTPSGSPGRRSARSRSQHRRRWPPGCRS